MARADSAMATLTATSETLDAAASSLSVVLGRMERGEGVPSLAHREVCLGWLSWWR